MYSTRVPLFLPYGIVEKHYMDSLPNSLRTTTELPDSGDYARSCYSAKGSKQPYPIFAAKLSATTGIRLAHSGAVLYLRGTTPISISRTKQ
jgi:predicted nucleic acid binding AN1-type Zn finger protein